LRTKHGADIGVALSASRNQAHSFDRLYHENDGNGAHAPVQIATITLSGTTAPAYSDFLLVV
jgi:hypothetical protein